MARDWTSPDGRVRLICGDCRNALEAMPDESVNCIVTSPPYYGLRDYGVDGQIGLEQTPEEYVAELVGVFRQARRVLRKDGTLWLNLGDSYAGYHGNKNAAYEDAPSNKSGYFENQRKTLVNHNGIKNKDLIGIPWRVAFALQADGWYLRQDIIWCLSGGTSVYARTQKGDMPMMVRDLARLRNGTVKLWNGEKWTSLLGVSKSPRKGNEIVLTLRSGERISCTPTHKFPTNRGLLDAGEITVGDALEFCILPEPENPKKCVLDSDAAWLAGLYIAEGSRSGDCIQISGHAKEEKRWDRLQFIAQKFGGSATRTVSGNKMDIRLYGKILVAIIEELVSGRTSKDKGFAPVVWRYSNQFVASMLQGYLDGDGHWDEMNSRWRLGFTRNYNLERDLRCACARLGYHLKLKMATVFHDGRDVPTFRGEIRMQRSGHHNEKSMNEVISITKARCREVYDLGVEDAPNTFALASGVLTHNSKPNPMPESVRDRCTKAHEYIFLLAKSERYYYDMDAMKEDGVCPAGTRAAKGSEERASIKGVNARPAEYKIYDGKRNRRSVWTVTTKPFKEAHFATFPPDLIEPCVLAGCPAGGTVLDPFNGAGTTGLVASRHNRAYVGVELNPDYFSISQTRIEQVLADKACELPLEFEQAELELSHE